MDSLGFLSDDDSLPYLLEILYKLRQLAEASSVSNTKTPKIAPKTLLSQIFSMTNALEKPENQPSFEEFRSFIRQAHNLFVSGDSSLRSSVLRVTRYCLPENCSSSGDLFARDLVAEEFHWLVVTSFERETEYAVERSQAFKLMSKVLLIAPMSFPASFARSLVAVANHVREENVKEDAFKKPSISMLRELALANPRLVAAVNGFVCLVEAVVDPISLELAESILLSLLYLLNNAHTRKIVQPCIDLRILLSPFTDLDTEPSKLTPKWQAAKSALVMMMRSWVGVVMVSSDEMALPTLVQMLRDPKVPVPTQDIILETISEVLSPSDFKVRVSNRARHQQVLANNIKGGAFVSKTSSNANLHAVSGSDSISAFDNPDLKAPHILSSDAHHMRHYSISGDLEISSISTELVVEQSRYPSTAAAVAQHEREANFVLRSFSKDGKSGPSQTVLHQQQYQLQQKQQQQQQSSIRQAAVAALTGSSSPNAPRPLVASGSSNNLVNMRSQVTSQASSPHLSNPSGEVSKAPRSHSTLTLPNFGLLNLFDRSSSPGMVKKKVLAHVSGNNTPVNGNNANNNINSKVFATSSNTVNNSASTPNVPVIQRPVPKPAAAGNDFSSFGMIGLTGDGASTASRSRQSSTKSSPDIHYAAAAAVAASATGSDRSGFPDLGRSNEIIDPIFNMMDNYTALLCSAFLHVDLIQSLYYLGIHGSMSVAARSRKLMVKYLRILARIFPERRCSELLTIPSLVEFAAITTTSATTNRAHKSSQILISLAEAFSLMPYKQVTGKHISRPATSMLSPSNQSVASPTVGFDKIGPFNPNTSRPKSGNLTLAGGPARIDASIFQEKNVSTLTSSNATGKESVYFALNSRSNFASLNIVTIYELAEEIKISSLCTISAANQYSSKQKSAKVQVQPEQAARSVDVIKSLRESVTPIIDKNEFQRQMNQSKVTGKEGKEPFKWDWVCISDTLEYSFQNADRLTEALNSKWLKRLCGFYRCSVDEKGYFANLDWEPTHLQYMECAFNLYAVLLQDDIGLGFLNDDRRGMLFKEIAQEIEQLYTVANRSEKSYTSGPNVANVFRMFSCNFTMAREYFTILGRVMKFPNSMKLLNGTNIFQVLTQIGSVPTLDYLTRLLFTSLSFTDGGVMSRPLLMFWTTNNSCSTSLRLYFQTLLRVLLGSKPSEAFGWCVEAVCDQLHMEEWQSAVLFKALEEVVHNKEHLRIVVSKKPDLQDEPLAQRILLRFLAIPEGIEFLSQQRLSKSGDALSWLDRNVLLWQESESRRYTEDVEERISVALSRVGKSEGNADICKGIVPIPIQTPDFVGELTERQGSQTSGDYFENVHDPNGALALDLHGLLRVPWNMEVKLTTQAAYQALSSPEYLKVDTFLDVSELSSPFCFETTSDSSRLIRVRGIVLDGKGYPYGQIIPQNKIISNTLMAGVCPINKDGRITNTSDGRSRARRRTASTVAPNPTNRESLATSRASISSASGGGGGNSNGDLSGISSEADVAITLSFEQQYEWFQCRPGHRQGNLIELGDGRFSVIVPGDPVVWIFSRINPKTTSARNSSLASSRAGSAKLASNSIKTTRKMSIGSTIESAADLNLFSNSQNKESSRAGGLIYLVEVQYYLRLETGQALFVPMPRHLFGELARTSEGCSYLFQKKIVTGLVSSCRHHPAVAQPSSPVKQPQTQSQSQPSDSFEGGAGEIAELRAALWSLGHIGSSELGFKLINTVDTKFVEFCVHNTCFCGNYSLRGTFFFVLGLFSRTIKGSAKLNLLQWEAAPLGSNSAVAIPKNPSVLFKSLPLQAVSPSTSSSIFVPVSRNHSSVNSSASSSIKTEASSSTMAQLFPLQKSSSPFMNQPTGTTFAHPGEAELLNLVSKLPGGILYRDTKHRLEALKKERPELFSTRSVYLEVLRMLDTFTFKLTARRELVKLFFPAAKLK